jgi:hypothetical protein
MREYLAACAPTAWSRAVKSLVRQTLFDRLIESPSELRSSGGHGLSELTPVDFLVSDAAALDLEPGSVELVISEDVSSTLRRSRWRRFAEDGSLAELGWGRAYSANKGNVARQLARFAEEEVSDGLRTRDRPYHKHPLLASEIRPQPLCSGKARAVGDIPRPPDGGRLPAYSGDLGPDPDLGSNHGNPREHRLPAGSLGPSRNIRCAERRRANPMNLAKSSLCGGGRRAMAASRKNVFLPTPVRQAVQASGRRAPLPRCWRICSRRYYERDEGTLCVILATVAGFALALVGETFSFSGWSYLFAGWTEMARRSRPHPSTVVEAGNDAAQNELHPVTRVLQASRLSTHPRLGVSRGATTG